MLRKKENQDEIVKAYKRLFTTRDGKFVLSDLAKNHNFLSTSFKKDAMELAFSEGERNVILRILHILDLDLEKMRERMKEYDEELSR